MQTVAGALELCRDLSDQLDQIVNYDSHKGADCLAFSDEETESIHRACQAAFDLGARVFQDQAGNITAVIEGTDPDTKILMGGSHLDAVPQGGQYDGRAGVLLQLGVMQAIKDGGVQLPHGVALQISRAEESPRFGKGLLGSLFATGRGIEGDFSRSASFGEEEKLIDAIRGQNLPADELLAKVLKKEPLLPLDHIGGMIEMHIEQANVIRSQGADVGVVTAIRGNTRADIRFLGSAGHTGGEAQFSMQDGVLHDERREASRGIAELAYLAEQQSRKIAAQGRDIVFSLPQLETPDSSPTKICDDAYARIEARSTDQSVLDEMKSFIEDNAHRIAQERRLEIAQEQVVNSAPVSRLSDSMIALLERSATECGLKPCRLPSGAGHDAMNFQLVGVDTSMIFIPHNGLSHRPDENMVLNDGDDPYAISSPFANALKTIYTAMVNADMPKKDMAVRPTGLDQAFLNCGAVEIKPGMI